MGEADLWSPYPRPGQSDQDPARDLRDLVDDPPGRGLGRPGRDLGRLGRDDKTGETWPMADSYLRMRPTANPDYH